MNRLYSGIKLGFILCISSLMLATTAWAQSPSTVVKPQPKPVDREASGDAPTDPGPLADGLSGKLYPRDIQVAMRKVADWQIAYAGAKFNQQWTYAPLYEGLIMASRSMHDPTYESVVEKTAKGFDWQLVDDRFPHADDEALGRVYLELYQAHPDPKKIASVKTILDRLVARPDDPNKPVWWWCDALYMAPPVLMRMYAVTGDRKYIDYMDREWWITYNLLYDKNEQLYFRDASFLQRKEKNGKPLFWARGNGWVLAGLAQLLELMPRDYPTRPKYIAEYKEMSAKIASLQQPDGLWKTGLLDPENYSMSEVSGSAFYTYGLAWGIHRKLLDAKLFQPVVAKSWAGMVSHIYASGRLGSIQPVGAAPDAFTASSSYVFGVGGFLLAGSELNKK
ncbi:glycoside hydrolase family 88/105 protein [Granulicella paludicola]|uniref:glycoside hydrolase family 88/105 protein n=1 Tax=Granulicella paludicola TaxID=474951 RepID=UPI0021DFB745|nr:glycoside hydrolase family 88 protein [Granulicella paludicola]